ncbi:MAG TPA: DUF4249 domain-containing protein [Chryseosolibacter sp.]
MKKYIASFLLLTLCACELVVDVDIPIEKRNLVLSSFFNPDSTWKAKVSLSRHILDEAPYPFVSDAIVVVFEGENAIDTLEHDSLGYYRSADEGPKPGKSYSIRAVTSEHGTASGSSFCPQIVPGQFSSLQTSVGEFGQPEYSFTITFTDPAGKDFYQVMAIGEYRYTNPYTGQGFVNRSNVRVWSDDEGIDNEELENYEGFFFPDAIFNGEEFSVNVKMTPNMWGGSASSKYFIYFRAVSEDYYKYKITSMLQNHVGNDPFAQPVKVYNNIENGFGIIGGFTQTVLIIEP